MQFVQESSAFLDVSGSQYLFGLSIIATSFILGMTLSFYLLRLYKGPNRISKGVNAELNGPVNSRLISNDLVSTQYTPTEEISDKAFLAQQIKSVIKNLINSQYVLKDKARFTSLFQTPLRQSIHQLRLISESLLAPNNAAVAPQTNKTIHEVCSAQNAIEKQVALIASLATEYKVKFDATSDDLTNIHVGVTEEWLSTAVREILFNAIKHNPQNIDLSLSCKLVDHFLLISVIDNGKGFPHAVSQKFCDKAMLANTLYRRKSDSENLINLTLIQHKLITLGGKLVVKSARNYMAQVECWIPTIKPSLHPQWSQLTKVSNRLVYKHSSNSTVPKVLWLSDDSALNDSIYDNLGQDFILQKVLSVEQALTAIATFKPDCVLIDEENQVTDSLCVKRWIHASDKFSDIPVIVLGGLIDKSAQLSVLQTGLSAVVEKPVVASELKTVIHNVVAEKTRLLQRIEEAIADYHTNSLQNIEFTDSPSDIFLAQFSEMLERNFHDDTFRLAQAAQIMHMADKTLSRRIGKYYQLKFCDLIKKFRLNKAKELIIKGERITNVAYDTGFSSPSYFTQCFRAEFGFAPSMLARK